MKTDTPASLISNNLQDLFQASLDPGDAYIRFQLTSEVTALLSMKQVQGSLIVKADRINTLPNMPEQVIGMMSYRDRVFCVFDLAQLLGISFGLNNSRQYQVIVLKTTSENPIYIGLAVINILGIIRLTIDRIRFDLDNFSSKIVRYCCGIFEQDKSIIPVLDIDGIDRALSQIIA